jgi:hypothetical protein
MPDQHSGSDRLPTEHLARAAGAVALAAVAVIHVIDLPSTLSETPLIGYGYFLLIAAALLGAALLLTVPETRVWILVDLVAFGAILAYVLSRTSGLPTDRFDVGNWNCALGIAAVSTETLIVLLAVWRMQHPVRPLSTADQSTDHSHDSHDSPYGEPADFTR